MVLLNGVAIVALDLAHDAVLISAQPLTGQPIVLQIHEFQKLHFTSYSFKLTHSTGHSTVLPYRRKEDSLVMAVTTTFVTFYLLLPTEEIAVDLGGGVNWGKPTILYL